MAALDIALGFALGLVGGGAHLWLTHLRARLWVTGRRGHALSLLAPSLLVVAACALLAASHSSLAALAVLPGLFAVRTFVLLGASDAE